jgi:hypothetical protein
MSFRGETVMDEATFERLRELVEAEKAGGWQEVVAALDMGDIVLALRGDRGALTRAIEVTGLSKTTLWRRGKLAEFRAEIEEAKPANLTEALRLVKKLEAETEAAGGENDTDAEKPNKGGRPKRDPLEVLKEQLHATASALARQQLMSEDDAIAIVRAAYLACRTLDETRAKFDADPKLAAAAMDAFKGASKSPPATPKTESNEEKELVGLLREALKAEGIETKPPASFNPGAKKPEPASAPELEPVDTETKRELVGGTTPCFVFIEGHHGIISSHNYGFGLYSELTIEKGRLRTTQIKEGSRSERPFGDDIRNSAVVIAKGGANYPHSLPAEPEGKRWLEPDEYRAYWSQYLRAFEDAGCPILFTNIGPELFAGYPERKAAGEENDHQRRVEAQKEEERKAKEKAFWASAVDKVAGTKRAVPATLCYGHQKPFIREVGLQAFRVGAYDGRDRAVATYKEKGGGYTRDLAFDRQERPIDGGARVINVSRHVEGEPVVVLKGYGHKLPADRTWADIRRYVEKNKPEVLLDWWPDDFTHETKGGAA